jgi:hypothetical protein
MRNQEFDGMELIGVQQPYARNAFDELGSTLAVHHREYGHIRQGHIARSHAAINEASRLALQAASPDTPTKALILGPGPCVDIPLAQVVEAFDQTTLVDINATKTAAAIEQLPPALQSKVEVVADDLTGCVDKVESSMVGSDLRNFLTTGAEVLDAIDTAAEAVSFGTAEYDFVSSHLIHDQFAASIRRVVVRMLEGRFNDQFAEQSIRWHPGFKAAFADFKSRLEQTHLDMLARTVSRTGIIHFADSYDYRMTAEPRGMSTTSLEIPDSRFSLARPPESWLWPIAHIKFCTVTAYALRSALADRSGDI